MTAKSTTHCATTTIDTSYRYMSRATIVRDYKVSLGSAVELNSRECPKLIRGNAAVPVYMSLCEGRWCCTAAVLRRCLGSSEKV